MLGVPIRREGGHLDCDGRCGRRCVCRRRLPSGRPRRRRPRGGNLLWRSDGRLRYRCSGWSNLCRLSGLEQHSTPRPRGRRNDERRGTGRGYDDGLCSRRRHDDHATASEPPRWHGKSLVRRREARSHHHQHHHPQARVTRHGNTPCFTVRAAIRRDRNARRVGIIRIPKRNRQHRPPVRGPLFARRVCLSSPLHPESALSVRRAGPATGGLVKHLLRAAHAAAGHGRGPDSAPRATRRRQ